MPFKLSLSHSGGTTQHFDVVDQVIAPQGTMRFWSVFLPEDPETGERQTIFFNEEKVSWLAIEGKDEEEEEPEGATVHNLRIVGHDEGTEGA